jgi:hypothetical protein
MKKLFTCALVLAGALFFSAPARAQFTRVSGTVTDPNGIPYAGGTISAVLVPTSPGGWTLSGAPYGGRLVPAQLDSTGTFSVQMGDNGIILPAGSQWLFTVNSNPGGIPSPLGTGAQTFTATITITGATQNIGATLTALAPKLTNFGGGSSLITGNVTATHLTFASAANVLGDVLGTSVTAGTGAISITATGNGVTPVSISAFSVLPTVPVLSVSSDIPGPVTCANLSGQPIGVVPIGCFNSGTDSGTTWGVVSMGSGAGIVGVIDTATNPTLKEYSYVANIGGTLNLVGGGGTVSQTLGTFIFLDDNLDNLEGDIALIARNPNPKIFWSSVNLGNFGQTYTGAIDGGTGEIGAGWINTNPVLSKQGFFSIVDASFLHKLSMKMPGTMAADAEWDWPITAGLAGQVLESQGGAGASMIWTASTFPTNLLFSATAPTVSSGFGTGATITANNGPGAFRLSVGTSNTGTGVIGLPTAATGWNCYATNITTKNTNQATVLQTASTVSSATLQNYTDVMGTHAMTDNDVLAVTCFAF